MAKKNGLRSIAIVLGLMVLFVTGYMATSVMTSCPAEAQLCCATSQCVSLFNGMSVNGGLVGAVVVIPGILWAAASISLFYGATMLSFVAVIVERIAAVNNNWDSWWDTLWFYNFRPALQDMTRQLAVVSGEQTRIIGSLLDMLDRHRSFSTRHKHFSHSYRRQAPSENLCVAATVAGGLAQAGRLRADYQREAPVERLRRGSNQAGSSGSSGPFVDLDDRYRRYVERYCDPNENGGVTDCEGRGSVRSQQDGAGERDLDDRDIAFVFMNETLDLPDDDVRTMIDDMVMNLAEPVVLPLQNPETFGTGAGREYALRRQSYQARRQVAHGALYHVVARRAPGSGLGAPIAAMRQEAGTAPLASEDPSLAEVLHVMGSERPRTPQYHTRMIGTASKAARERVIQSGLITMQLHDMMDLYDRWALVVAAQVGTKMKRTAIKTTGHLAVPFQFD